MNILVTGAKGFVGSAFVYELLRNLPFIIVMAVGATPLPRRIYLKIKERFAPACIILPLLAFFVSLAYIVGSGYNPFLYFRF